MIKLNPRYLLDTNYIGLRFRPFFTPTDEFPIDLGSFLDAESKPMSEFLNQPQLLR